MAGFRFFSHPESQGRDDQQLYESDFSLPLTWKQAFFCGEPMYEGYDIRHRKSALRKADF